IDDDSRPLQGELYPEIVRGPNLTRARAVERLFYCGPPFFGLTAFTELSVLGEAGLLDAALYQTQDYLQWVRLLHKYELQVLPDVLYKLRIRAGWENLSGPAPEKQVRARDE